MDDDFLPSLLCQESETCLDEEFEDEDTFITLTNYTASEEDRVEMLMERETVPGFKKADSWVFGNRLKCARLEAITWILKVSTASFLE